MWSDVRLPNICFSNPPLMRGLRAERASLWVSRAVSLLRHFAPICPLPLDTPAASPVDRHVRGLVHTPARATPPEPVGERTARPRPAYLPAPSAADRPLTAEPAPRPLRQRGPMDPAHYRLLADLVVVVHLAFVAFVVAGGLLVLRWPRLAWAHVPAAAWGALIEFAGWVCPLTPLENDLRRLGGEGGYGGGFVERYLVGVLYPGGLTRAHQVALGLLVLAINGLVYWRLWRRSRASPPRP